MLSNLACLLVLFLHSTHPVNGRLGFWVHQNAEAARLFQVVALLDRLEDAWLLELFQVLPVLVILCADYVIGQLLSAVQSPTAKVGINPEYVKAETGLNVSHGPLDFRASSMPVTLLDWRMTVIGHFTSRFDDHTPRSVEHPKSRECI